MDHYLSAPKQSEGMDFLSCILSALIIAWISICALYYSFGRRSASSRRLPPGPKPLPFIGNLLEIGDKPHISVTKLSQCYGPIMTLQLGQTTTVVVSSSSMAKKVLRTHDQLFSNRTIPASIQACKHGEHSLVWLPVSEKWRNLRRICNNQLFATRVLDANQSSRHLKVQELIAHVRDSAAKGKGVAVGRAAFVTSLNFLSRSVFSVDLADPKSERAREFTELVWSTMEEIARPNMADYFPILKKIDPTGIRRRLANHLQKMFDLFDCLIVQRLESRKAGDYVMTNDMLDTLLNNSEEKHEDMDMLEIKHLFLDLFIAATDTTSATLEWAMAELLCNPEKLLKAQDELKKIIGKGKPVQESDIARLPYLQAIIKETFRLHPAVPFLVPRKVEANIEIDGYIVPKGAQVWVNVYAISRDTTTWNNPNSFLPERFLGSEIDVMGRHFELTPFGSGRRICPGLPLAMRMLSLMLGSLINSFSDWKLEDGLEPESMNMEEKFGLTLQKAQPLIPVPIP